MIQTYSNRKESAQVLMDGECLGANLAAKTCVRKTSDGRFAVITTRGSRLIKVLDSESHARNYNAKLQPYN